VKRSQGWIALASALLAPLLALVLVSCGSSQTAADPFVGTWRSLASRPSAPTQPVYIVKTQAGYLAIILNRQMANGPGGQVRIPLTRQGDTLAGSFADPRGKSLPVKVVYLPASGHLTWSNGTSGTAMSKPDEMGKLSDSTAVPSPSAYLSPSDSPP